MNATQQLSALAKVMPRVGGRYQCQRCRRQLRAGQVAQGLIFCRACRMEQRRIFAQWKAALNDLLIRERIRLMAEQAIFGNVRLEPMYQGLIAVNA